MLHFQRSLNFIMIPDLFAVMCELYKAKDHDSQYLHINTIFKITIVINILISLCGAFIWFFFSPKYFRSPLSSMVFGTNALFTKPAQSLAPMLVVTILNQFGYENLNNEVAQPDPR